MNTDNKPYFFVHAPKLVQGILQEGSHTGALKITIIVETPVHFGSGQIFIDKNRFIYRLNRENEEIVLPGSSFKGMIRSFFEAVSESCILSNKDIRCKSNTKICLACSVFGRLGKKGRAGFSAFRTKEQPQTEIFCMPKLYGPRIVENNYRKFYKHSNIYDQISDKSDSNLHYECLCQKATLHGVITYQGLTRDQLGGLLFALGLGWGNDKTLYHKLGYGKPAYFGSIRLEVASVRPEVAPEFIGGSIISCDKFSKGKLEKLAKAYYREHSASVSEAVNEFMEKWAVDSIGSDCQWDMSTGTTPTY